MNRWGLAHRFASLVIFSVLLLGHSQLAWSSGDYAKTLYQRLAGVPLSPHRADYPVWQDLMSQQDWNGLARRAVEESTFLDVTALQWATLYYMSGKSATVPLDDAITMLVGSVRDNLDARLLLTGDFHYAPDPRLGNKPSISDNTAYEVLAQRQLSLKIGITRVSPQWDVEGYENAAGLLTTRSFAALNYSAGTNRRAVRAALETFLCRPNNTWMVPNLPPTWIRRDVDRAPGGDARVFEQNCRSCHVTLDGMGGAFAFFDYSANGTFEISREIQPKFLQHSEVYPDGYVTADDTWVNLMAQSQDSLGQSFGWRGETQGRGINAFGKMLTSSKEFGACLAKRVFSTVCLQDKSLTDPVIQQLATEFETQDSYQLKNLFVRTALRPECISH